MKIRSKKSGLEQSVTTKEWEALQANPVTRGKHTIVSQPKRAAKPVEADAEATPNKGKASSKKSSTS